MPRRRRRRLAAQPLSAHKHLTRTVQDLEQIPADAVEKLKADVFKDDEYYITSIDKTSKNAILIKGNIRMNDTAKVCAASCDPPRPRPHRRATSPTYPPQHPPNPSPCHSSTKVWRIT